MTAVLTARIAIPARRPTVGVRLRARTDCSWVDADTRLTIDRGVRDDGLVTPRERAFITGLDPIEPGDAWPISWSMGGHAGYAIVCPRCRQVHTWTLARNCGFDVVNGQCGHKRDGGKGSCWTWTGDLAAGTLTADPSLLNGDPECGWHGWLKNGELVEA